MRWAGANLMRLDVTRHSEPEWAIERHVRAARGIGCRGLEIRMVSGKLLWPDLPLSERRRIADLVAAAGLEICVVGSDCKFAKPPAIARSREIDRWTGFINLAQEWGASIVRVFGGRYDYTIPPSEADSWVEEGLCAMLETDGIRVALETHDDFNSRVRVGRILRSAAQPDAAAVWDTGHPHALGESVAEVWEAIAPLLVLRIHTQTALFRQTGMVGGPALCLLATVMSPSGK